MNTTDIIIGLLILITIMVIYNIYYPYNDYILGSMNYITEKGLKKNLINYTTPNIDQYYLKSIPQTNNYSFITSKGYKLSYWYCNKHASKTIIYFPGYGTTRAFGFNENRIKLISKLFEVNVITCDYRGTADIDGTYNEMNMIEDAIEYIKYLLPIYDLSGSEVILWGFSISCNILFGLYKYLTEMKINISGLILEAPAIRFSYNIITDRILRKLINYNYTFSNPTYYNFINSPIFMMHGRKDKLVHIKQSHELFKEFIKLNKLVTINFNESCGHNALLYREPIFKDLVKFINSY